MSRRRQQFNSPSYPTRREVRRVIGAVVEYLEDFIPGNQYWGFSTYQIIVPEVLRGFTHFVLPQPGAVGSFWNMADAVMQGAAGIRQLFDKETHRGYMSKLVGGTNVSSSVQLATLTIISAAGFGPAAFAAAFFTGFVLSFDATVRAGKRWNDDVYWLEDSMSQLNKTEKLAEKLEQELDAFKTQLNNQPKINWLQSNALNAMEERLKGYWDTCKTLQLDIEAYVGTRPHLHSTINKLIADRPEDIGLVDRITKPFLGEKHPNTAQFLMKMKDLPCLTGKKHLTPAEQNKLDYYQRRIEVSKMGCKLETVDALSNTITWGLAFTGMLLMCIPGAQPAGAIIVAIASAIYFAKNSEKIYEKTRQLYNYLKEKLNAPPVPKLEGQKTEVVMGAKAQSPLSPPPLDQRLFIETVGDKKTLTSPRTPGRIATGFIREKRKLVESDFDDQNKLSKMLTNHLLTWLKSKNHELKAEPAFKDLFNFLLKSRTQCDRGRGPSLEKILEKLITTYDNIDKDKENPTIVTYKHPKTGEENSYTVTNTERLSALGQAIKQVEGLMAKVERAQEMKSEESQVSIRSNKKAERTQELEMEESKISNSSDESDVRRSFK